MLLHTLTDYTCSCLCAGPYAHRLLGLTPADAAALEELLLHKKEVLRPGFVRLSLAYYWSPATLDYVMRAVGWIAQHGHRLLPSYLFLSDTGKEDWSLPCLPLHGA